jgi:hypothetical protein
MEAALQTALDSIQADARYQRNIAWGAPRPGHPEGSLHAHIVELEENLARLAPLLDRVEILKLRLLIHTHDTFKAESPESVSITNPASHASLARDFLARFSADEDLLLMAQYHDEPFALWRQWNSKGTFSVTRMSALLSTIRDWELFSAFLIIDGCTVRKSREPLHWFFGQVAGKISSRFGAGDLLP